MRTVVYWPTDDMEPNAVEVVKGGDALYVLFGPPPGVSAAQMMAVSRRMSVELTTEARREWVHVGVQVA